jgi:Fur family ferric uptake transcriptional regulator
VASRRAESRPERLKEAKDKLGAYLKDRGLRATRQRDAVLEAFVNENAHVSVDELYDRIRVSHPHIGHATVYRCMSLFAEAGIAKERHFHEDASGTSRGWTPRTTTT